MVVDGYIIRYDNGCKAALGWEILAFFWKASLSGPDSNPAKKALAVKKHFDALKALLLKNFMEDEKVTPSPYALSKATL